MALALTCLFPALAGSADGTAVPVTGGSWYWQEQIGPQNPPPGSPLPPLAPPAPLPTPDVPSGDFPVSVVGGQPDKESFLQLDSSAIVQGSTVSSLVLTLQEDPGASGKMSPDMAHIEARAVTGFMTSGTQGGPWGNRPGFDTTGPAGPGTRAGDGKWTFDLTALAQRWASGDLANNGVALVPAAPGNGQTYEVVWFGTAAASPPAVSGSFTPPAPGSPEGEATTAGGTADTTPPAPVAITPDLSTGAAAPSSSLSTPAATPATPTQPAAPAARINTRARAIAESSHRGPPWSFFLAVIVAIALIAASTFSLGDLGEPQPGRRGGVLRALERRAEEVP